MTHSRGFADSSWWEVEGGCCWQVRASLAGRWEDCGAPMLSRQQLLDHLRQRHLPPLPDNAARFAIQIKVSGA